MKFLENIPFVNDEGDEESKGRVRLLGKLERFEGFDPNDFNELVTQSVQNVENKLGQDSAILADEIEQDVEEEDLLNKHLSYRIKVGSVGDTEEDQQKRNIAEGASLKVILRSQPTKAIEINGPGDISAPYKEALQESFKETHGKTISFTDILCN